MPNFELLNFKDSLLLRKSKDSFNLKSLTRKRTNTNRINTQKVTSSLQRLCSHLTTQQKRNKALTKYSFEGEATAKMYLLKGIITFDLKMKEFGSLKKLLRPNQQLLRNLQEKIYRKNYQHLRNRKRNNTKYTMQEPEEYRVYKILLMLKVIPRLRLAIRLLTSTKQQHFQDVDRLARSSKLMIIRRRSTLRLKS